ncbi:MAG TPA: hypothetical protein VF646_00225, partial [Cytophagales bacterium]
MPTQEMPDNELDDLFRKAAGEYNAEFEPEAWKRMEQLLDERDGRTGGYWWKGVLLGLALLVVGTLGFVLLRNPERTPGPAITENRQPGTTAAPAGANGPAATQRPAGSGAPEGSDVTARGTAPEAGTRPASAGQGENETRGKGAPEPRAATGQPAGEKATTGEPEAVNKVEKPGKKGAPEKASRESTGNSGRTGNPTKVDGLPGDAGNRENDPAETPRIAAKRTPSPDSNPPNGIRPGPRKQAAPGTRKRLASRDERAVSTNPNAPNIAPGVPDGAKEQVPPGTIADHEPDRAEPIAT